MFPFDLNILVQIFADTLALIPADFNPREHPLIFYLDLEFRASRLGSIFYMRRGLCERLFSDIRGALWYFLLGKYMTPTGESLTLFTDSFSLKTVFRL